MQRAAGLLRFRDENRPPGCGALARCSRRALVHQVSPAAAAYTLVSPLASDYAAYRRFDVRLRRTHSTG
eukprot:7482028-Pyramimonas_sp.AAC.1